MRRLTLILVVVALAPAARLHAELSPLERQRLVAHLEMTSSWLLDELTGLSPAQLEFRRARDSWTILEVLDHLVVVGPIYWEDLQKGVGSPRPLQRSGMTDADVLWYGIDRTHRETALKSETPRGQYRSLEAALAAYRRQHAQLLQYVQTTKDELRSRLVERQGCDAYQWALLISTHEQRHILQIREIKRDPRYPTSRPK